jgi:signal transduction histidine kinase
LCRLGDIIQEVIALVQPACRHRKVDLRIQGSGGNATELCRSPLSADPDQLRQLILNLLLNAMEAAGSGGWIGIECFQDEAGDFLVRISDSGPGPSAAVAERLFEPFVTDKPEGVGLGLALSRQIAEAHDGTLRFCSETGSCFELRLPSHVQAKDRHLPTEALCS